MPTLDYGSGPHRFIPGSGFGRRKSGRREDGACGRGAVPHEAVGAWLRQADVGIVPFKAGRVARAKLGLT